MSNKISDVYIQKALGMSKYFSMIMSGYIGFLLALVPIIFSGISQTSIAGNSIHPINDTVVKHVLHMSVSIDFISGGVILGVITLIWLAPVAYLRLKYQEYNVKYIRASIYELTDEYFKEKKIESHDLKHLVDNPYAYTTWKDVITYLKSYTLFDERYILDELYVKYWKHISDLKEVEIFLKEYDFPLVVNFNEIDHSP